MREHENYLRLHPRMDQSRAHLLAGREHHGVGEPGQKRAVNTHGPLFGHRGEPELHADNMLAARQPATQRLCLHFVGGGDVQVVPAISQRRNLRTARFSVEENAGSFGYGHCRWLGGHAARSASKATVTGPNSAKSARTVSPPETGIAGVHDPGSTTSPASRVTPSDPSVFASHTSAATGSPRTAPPAPVATSDPFRERLHPTSRRSS